MPVVEKNSVTDKTSNLVHVGVILNPKIVDDELLAFHGVFAHVVFQQFLNAEVVAEDNGFKAHVGADEASELVGRDFAQALESVISACLPHFSLAVMRSSSV